MNAPGIQTRITVTERGRALQKEMMRDLKLETSFQSNRSGGKGNSFSPPQTLQSHRTNNGLISRRDFVYLSVPTTGLDSSRINRSFRSKSKDADFVKLPRIEFRSDLDQNPFVKKKLEKMNRNIEKLETRNETKYQKTAADNLPYLMNTDNSYAYTNIYDHSISNQTSTRNDLNDKLVVRNYVKMLHRETEVETLLKRHQKNLDTMEKIQEEVHKKYRKLKRFEEEENHKPPALLDDIRHKYPEAVDALHRETNFFNRKVGRVREKAKEKYQPFWSNFQDLSRKK